MAGHINDLDSDSALGIQIDDQGNADGAEVIAALDQSFDDLIFADPVDGIDPVTPDGNDYA